ncbi:MAG: adenylosuccinate lyase [archaeon]
MVDYNYIVADKYSSADMRLLFSKENTILNWRKCWIALAEAQNELGLKRVSKSKISELKKQLTNLKLDLMDKYESELKHDVMAAVKVYGDVCPNAKDIIHLGATSQFVKCNTDLIVQREALVIIRKQLLNLLKSFEKLIDKTKNIPTVGYTHFQPAQPTTFGKRFSVYAYDLLTDLEDLDAFEIPFRGAKGATGTQASFLKLFDGDVSKVKKLDMLIAKKMGFSKVFPITTQTYTRKLDIKIASLLANIASTCKKFATDIRLLSNLKLLDEPFGSKQVGSSAMPYKQNPMKSERISSLARKVMNNLNDFYQVYSEQWLERSLDDSAIRRIDIPENFMLTEYILSCMNQVVSGLVIYEKQSISLLKKELPFLATEEILMESVKKGADRQKIHEIIKKHSLLVAKNVKLNGFENDLLERLAKDKSIPLSDKELDKLLFGKSFTGMAINQCDDFLLILRKKLNQKR